MADPKDLKRRGRILKVIGIVGTIFFLVLEVFGVLGEIGFVSVFITVSIFLYGEMTTLEGTIVEKMDKQTEILEEIRESLSSHR